MYEFGEVINAEVQFTDTFETKIRPSLVLFEELGNVIVMGITSNLEMEGIKLTKKEGAVKDSVIKINYIFTISQNMIKKSLFYISKEKRKFILEELMKRLKIN